MKAHVIFAGSQALTKGCRVWLCPRIGGKSVVASVSNARHFIVAFSELTPSS